MDRITEYSVFWLDDKQNDPLNGYQIERSRFRRIIDYLKFFTQIEICIENIRSINDQQIFIIVASSCYLPLQSQIQSLSQVRSIYTYEENSNDGRVSGTTHVYEQVLIAL